MSISFPNIVAGKHCSTLHAAIPVFARSDGCREIDVARLRERLSRSEEYLRHGSIENSQTRPQRRRQAATVESTTSRNSSVARPIHAVKQYVGGT